MGFIGVYRAVYDYEPRDSGELTVAEGDLLYILEKNNDDGWWKAKKKAGDEDDDEPTGLVPHNYVEEAPVVCNARAIYEYTRQTDEELSFPEDAVLQVFDISDPDWILVGLDGEFGFVPSNYIDMSESSASADLAEEDDDVPPPALPTRPQASTMDQNQEPLAASDSGLAPLQSKAANPAAAILAGVMQGKSSASPPATPTAPVPATRPVVRFEEPAAESDEESVQSPALPSRPRPPHPHHAARTSTDYGEPPADEDKPNQGYRNPGGFHMYNISEMVSVMGKRKKMPTTLGINLVTGTLLIAPERAQDDPPQEWTAEKMTHYSREGKHVFMELVRPSKSIDFHAGAKDTAEEIVAALGELAGAARAAGLREVIEAGTKKNIKKGHILYDFMAQGDDEVTVAAGDEVHILDDLKSEEWWNVRRLRNGKEGVVPSSYIEITGTVTPPNEAADGKSNSVASTVEQNRREEIRLTKEAIRASKEPTEVGSTQSRRNRDSSLPPRSDGNPIDQQRSRRESSRHDSGNSTRSKPKPDSAKVRTWTDRSKSFSVEAQFLGLKDGKIHLHKMNGVKIAVPIAKMSHEDLEYVENITGISLDDERPLADVRRAKSSTRPSEPAGAKIERNKVPEYDWFQFFLSCDVAVGLCERYAQAFLKDSMDESVLPDVDATILRTLGLREGDIIKVMRNLDTRFGRDRSKSNADGEAAPGGLFSGPGGALRNNTRKGRPAPAVQTSNVVDATAFSKNDEPQSLPEDDSTTQDSKKPTGKQTAGFEDDAWSVKPVKATEVDKPLPTPVETASPPAAPPALVGSMKELSLLSQPLQPTKVEPQPTLAQSPITSTTTTPVTANEQVPGASPSFFSNMPSSPKSLARQRPTPGPISSNQPMLLPPPPQRSTSAPQSAMQSQFQAPLAPQMTGLVQGQVAPPGQSLNDIAQARMQQQYAQMQQLQQMQPTMTGFAGQQPGIAGYPVGNGTQFIQPMYTGMPNQSPFQDPTRQAQFATLQPQPTGFTAPFTQPQFTQPGTVNSFLPPALEPQRTGMPGLQMQPTGYNSVNSVSQHQQPQALIPQKTGPPPPVRFGVSNEAKKLAPQPTGRRANLSQATPDNPFGF